MWGLKVPVYMYGEGGGDARRQCRVPACTPLLCGCRGAPHMLTHPPQGACFEEGHTMLVTEYCEGGNLARNLAAGRISWYKRGKKVGG